MELIPVYPTNIKRPANVGRFFVFKIILVPKYIDKEKRRGKLNTSVPK